MRRDTTGDATARIMEKIILSSPLISPSDLALVFPIGLTRNQRARGCEKQEQHRRWEGRDLRANRQLMDDP